MSDIIERKPNGTFAKGCSGNPLGKVGSTEHDEVRRLAREETVASIQALARIRDSKTASAQARVTAAVALLDRGWGRPAQTTVIEADASLVVRVIRFAELEGISQDIVEVEDNVH
jgi:hypothetical protein